MSVATLVYTSSREASARREAAQAARFARVLVNVRKDGEWFGVKVYDDMGKHRQYGISAESVARLICEPGTDVEYWPVDGPEQDESGVSWRWGRGFVEH